MLIQTDTATDGDADTYTAEGTEAIDTDDRL
jgi:hypothetical protein